ncbi:MAG: polymerase PA [Bactrocera correcta orthomyxo-like virus isolate Bz]|nr:MAG: polymerase PA [Bactrocera correcta orthomyxo-like virus isolate Bz]
MDLRYKEIVESMNLYPIDFVQKFGQAGSHWSISTWKQRERSLAHDAICTLLCNMMLTAEAPSQMLGEYMKKAEEEENKKRAKTLLEKPSTSQQAIAQMEILSEDEDEPYECPDYSDEEEMEIDDIPGMKEQKYFRYKILEGMSAESLLQNKYLREWGVEPKTKVYDIIDIEEKKLIEVKFSIDPAKRIYEYNNHIDTDENTALIVVNPINAVVDTVNKDDKMPGISKMTNWVLLRSSMMETLEISDTQFDEESNITKFIFNNIELNHMLDQFRQKYTEDIEEEQDPKEFDKLNIELKQFSAEELFEKLSQDHLNESYEGITWDGKLLPPCWKELIEVDEDDGSNIDTFYNHFDESEIIEVTGDKVLYDFYQEIKLRWDTLDIPGKQFALFSTKNKKENYAVPEPIKYALGILKKGRTQSDVDGLKQPEYFPIPKRQYMSWFDKLIEKLSAEHPYLREYSFKMVSENHENIPLYMEAQMQLELLNKVVARSNVGILISETTNTFSRLSKSYLAGVGKTGSHARIVILPIRSTYYLGKENKVYKRRISGLLVRGPMHARATSDRINIVTIEMVNNSFEPEFVKKHCLIKFKDGRRLLIRQNAYKKIDAPYLAYIRNSLFNPANLLGDMLSCKMKKVNMTNLTYQADELLRNFESSRFFVDRVTENALMAVIGNSRDEGYFAMLRKLLMILLNSRRGEISFTFNLDEFCDSVNENLIDNPLSMHFHNSVLYVLAFYVTGSLD